MNGIPWFSFACGFFVSLIGSIMSPRKMLPEASTEMFIIPSTLTVSRRVSIRAHRPLLRRSGITVALHFVMPFILASTFDVPHGERGLRW